MDHFGIGPALQALLRVYLTGARGTGRTTSLINSVRDGDRIICGRLDEQRRLRELLFRANRDVEVIAIPPGHIDVIAALPPCGGRTLFEHTWVAEFYERALAQAARNIDELQKATSRSADLLGIPEIKPRPDTKFLHF